jgi:hypothetical protein
MMVQWSRETFPGDNVMKNYPEIAKNFMEGSKKLGAQEPETMKAFGALIKATTMKEGALSPKIKSSGQIF